MTKKYKKPVLRELGKMKIVTQGAASQTCDGSGSLGSGSNSNGSACTP